MSTDVRTAGADAGLRRLAVITAVAISLIAVLIGVRTGYSEMDVDEAVYRDTLLQMRAGEGYYPAMRDALIEKEGAPPSSARAIRPPTMFLLLRWFPEASWRWIVGLVFLAILLAAYKIGEPYGRYGAIAAVILTGFWVMAAAPFLFLHAELWGLPFFLWGAWSLRGRHHTQAAALVGAATLVRELFGLGLLIGTVAARSGRRSWVLTTGVAICLGLTHAALASQMLSPSGREAALANESINLSLILTILSPGDSLSSWIIGLTSLGFGIYGMRRVRRHDSAAAYLLPFCFLMLLLSLATTRVYWSLTWGPPVSMYALAALTGSARGR